MKLGFVSRISEFPESEWEGEFETAAKYKLDHLELIINYPYFGPLTCTDEQIDKLKRLSEKYSIELIFHLLPDYEVLEDYKDKKFDIASKDEEIRQFTIDEIKRTLEIAKKLNVKLIVIHGGKAPNEEEYNEHLPIARKSLKELAPLFTDVKLCVENLPSKYNMIPLHSLPRNPEDVLYLVKGLDIGICFDVGHANTIGDPLNFYNEIKDSKKIFDMHIHDNKGYNDTHTPIGNGNIDFRKFISQLKEDNYQGYFSIELDTFVEPPEPMRKDERIAGLEYLKDILSQQS